MCDRKRKMSDCDLFTEHDCLYYGDVSGKCLLPGGPYYQEPCPERQRERKESARARER